MKTKYRNRESERKKAWIGAAIAAGVSLLGSIGSSISNKNAQEDANAKELEAQKQLALQKSNAQKIIAGNQTASSLTNAYVNAYQNEQNFRNRFYKMGGRKKCAVGAKAISDIIQSVGGAVGNMASTGIANSGSNNPISAEIAGQFPELQYGESALTFKNNKATNTATYLNKPNNQQTTSPVIDSFLTSRKFKCGGRRRG